MLFTGELQELQAQEKKIVEPRIRLSRGELIYTGEGYITMYRTFREQRPPPPTGNVGDVWLDLRAHEVYYFNNTWNSWLGNSHNLRHPFLKEYRLNWSDAHRNVAWHSSSTICRLNKKFRGLEDVSSQRVVELIVQDSLSGHHISEARSATRKRKCRNLSVEPSSLRRLISMPGWFNSCYHTSVVWCINCPNIVAFYSTR